MFMVVFTSAEGKPAQHWTDSLDDAVRFVERLRNSEGVDEAKLYQMTEIPLEVKVQYRVEVAGPTSLEVSEEVPVSSAPSTSVSSD